jgi:hypothetical protein
MDHILQAGTFTDAETRRLNYCRLYLQAVTLSDLTKSTGDTLDHSKLAGHLSLQSSQTNWIAINQDRPSEKEWKLWQKANKLWSNDDGQLITPLRKWLFSVQTHGNNHFAYRFQRTLWIRDHGGNQYRQFRMAYSGHQIDRDRVLPFMQLPQCQPLLNSRVAPKTNGALRVQSSKSFVLRAQPNQSQQLLMHLLNHWIPGKQIFFVIHTSTSTHIPYVYTHTSNFEQ